MKIKSIKSRVNAYHNYKHNNILTNEIVIGDQVNEDKFFLIAKEVPYPEKFPNISLNNFNKRGERIATIKKNRILFIHASYKSERNNRNISILDGNGKVIFGHKSIEYTNVYITEISGEFYDENGNAVSITI